MRWSHAVIHFPPPDRAPCFSLPVVIADCLAFLPQMSYDFILTYKKGDTDLNTQSKNLKKTAFAIIALLILIAALLSVYRFTKQDTQAGAKTVTIDVIHADASLKTFTYRTDREYLGELLTDEALAGGEDGPYGLFITTVDGETADDTAQEWWCITKNQEMLDTSASQTPIADGDKYELTLTTGY